MINKIILGTVQMGLDYGINNHSGKISFEESCEILEKAFEMGVTTLDTAEAYGNAHKVIGDFHQLNPNLRYNIITKIPHAYNASNENIENLVRRYMNELHVDSLEVLMFHSFDSYEKNIDEITVLKKLKLQGLINHIGVSVYNNIQIETLLLDDDITVIQLPFNLLDNTSVRGDLIKEMKNKGKIVHTRSAFLQGLFFKEEFNNYVSQQLSTELTIIKDIAFQENTSISNLALNYCLVQNNIDQVLIGVDSVNQLIDNLNVLSYKISDKAIGKINSLKVKNLDLLNPSLWK